jgi:cysteine desulfurase/selenocysteine lyase
MSAHAAPEPRARPLDVEAVRRDFPLLAREVHGRRLVYLDNAATTQRPRCVVDAVERFYLHSNANVHRAVHLLSEEATALFEGARRTVRGFLNAPSERECVFVRGTTEAINLVAQSYLRPRVGPGDEVLVTEMEHHSNIVPWQLVCEQTGARLRVLPMDDRGVLRLEELEGLLTDRTRLVSVVHVSNALGTVNPVESIVAAAKSRGIPVLVDAAQSVPHRPVDVRALGCDFLAFSGHKVYGPMGIGVLWGREELLEAMPPWQGGGDMIASVSFEGSTWARLPGKFEAGTPNVAGAIGLAAALDYVTGLGLDAIAAHETDLIAKARAALREVPGLRFIGEADEAAGAVSFVLDGLHPHDVGTIVDREGVAIRTGHHCAEPVMHHFGIPASARASFGVYNDEDDLEALTLALAKVRELLG